VGKQTCMGFGSVSTGVSNSAFHIVKGHASFAYHSCGLRAGEFWPKQLLRRDGLSAEQGCIVSPSDAAEPFLLLVWPTKLSQQAHASSLTGRRTENERAVATVTA